MKIVWLKFDTKYEQSDCVYCAAFEQVYVFNSFRHFRSTNAIVAHALFNVVTYRNSFVSGEAVSVQVYEVPTRSRARPMLRGTIAIIPFVVCIAYI
jgi:hypothetical protein